MIVKNRLFLILFAACVSFLIANAFAEDITLTTLAPSGGAKIYSVSGNTDISTASSSFIDMEDMIIDQDFYACTAYIHFNAPIRDDVSNSYMYVQILVDGSPLIVSPAMNMDAQLYGYLGQPGINGYYTSIAAVTDLTAGRHTIKVQWKAQGGVSSQDGRMHPRYLIVMTDH